MELIEWPNENVKFRKTESANDCYIFYVYIYIYISTCKLKGNCSETQVYVVIKRNLEQTIYIETEGDRRDIVDINFEAFTINYCREYRCTKIKLHIYHTVN